MNVAGFHFPQPFEPYVRHPQEQPRRFLRHMDRGSPAHAQFSRVLFVHIRSVEQDRIMISSERLYGKTRLLEPAFVCSRLEVARLYVPIRPRFTYPEDIAGRIRHPPLREILGDAVFIDSFYGICTGIMIDRIRKRNRKFVCIPAYPPRHGFTSRKDRADHIRVE